MNQTDTARKETKGEEEDRRVPSSLRHNHTRVHTQSKNVTMSNANAASNSNTTSNSNTNNSNNSNNNVNASNATATATAAMSKKKKNNPPNKSKKKNKKKKIGNNNNSNGIQAMSIQLPKLKVTVRRINLHHIKQDLNVFDEEKENSNTDNNNTKNGDGNDENVSNNANIVRENADTYEKVGDDASNNDDDIVKKEALAQQQQMKVVLEKLCSNVSNVIFEDDPSWDFKKDHNRNEELVKNCNSGLVVHASILYMVLPKMSKRRGEIPGYAQLVLTPNRAQLVRSVLEASQSQSQAQSSSSIPSESNTGVSNKLTPDWNATVTPALKSQIMANAKLGLSNTLEAFIQQGKVMSLAVELCRHQKTYKPKAGKSKIIGTLEQSEGYISFVTARVKSEEERNVRKKPTPGGGEVEQEEQDKVAAIVQYLKERPVKQKKRVEKNTEQRGKGKEEVRRRREEAKNEYLKLLAEQKQTSNATTTFKVTANEFIPGSGVGYTPRSSQESYKIACADAAANPTPLALAYKKYQKMLKKQERWNLKQEMKKARKERKKARKQLQKGSKTSSFNAPTSGVPNRPNLNFGATS